MTPGSPTPSGNLSSRRSDAAAAVALVERRIAAIALRLGLVAGALGAIFGLLVSVWAIVPVGLAVGVLGWFVARRRLDGALAQAPKLGTVASVGDVAADRLRAVVESVSLQAGVAPPELHIVAGDALNAAAVVDADGAALVVTAGLAGISDTVLLEGVVARELLFLADGSALTASWHDAIDALPEGRLVPGPAAADTIDGVPLVTVADCAAVGITRYPPGLAATLAAAASNPAPLAGLTTRLDALALVPTTAIVDVIDRSGTLEQL